MRECHLRWNNFILNMWSRDMNMYINNPLCHCMGTCNNPVPILRDGYKIHMHIENKIRL